MRHKFYERDSQNVYTPDKVHLLQESENVSWTFSKFLI